MRDLSQDNREGSDKEIEAFTGLSVCVLVYAHTCIHHSHTVYPPLKESERLMHMVAETIVNVYNLGSTEARTERNKGTQCCRNGSILKCRPKM